MRIFDFLSTPSGAALLPLVDAVVKATILLATAGALSVVLRRASAAVRHLFWTLGLLGTLALPALSIALPAWHVAMIELPAVGQPIETIGASAPPPIRSAGAAGLNAATTDTVEPAGVRPRAPAAGWVSSLSWPATLLLVWLAGAAAILARLAVGLAAVEWMSRRTERVTEAPWLLQAQALAAELGIAQRITFLRSGRAAMPMACGIFRPAVLMPSDADHWPADRLRIVLLHELAHVKRRDCLTHVLAQVACAVYWFNPLAWIAARHVRAERERACDDLVLACGTPGADYADQLIEVARVMRAGRFPAILAGASLAMAHRSQLEGRLMAILDPTVPRSGLSRVRTAAATLVFAVAVMPLASLQPWSVEAAPSTPPTPAAAGQTPAPRPDAAPISVPDPDPAAQRSHGPVRPDVRPAVREGIAHGVAEGVRSGIVDGVKGAIAESVAAGVAGLVSGIADSVSEEVAAHVQGSPASAPSKAADPRTIAALTAALKDTDKDVRETALHALVQLRDPSIFGPLVQALSDPDPDVREEAAHGLGQLRDRRAVEPLTSALKDQNADVREQAIFALGQLRDRSTLAALTGALKDTDPDVREQAVFAIGQLRDPASADALMSVLHDAKADVRQQAVFALGQIRDRRAVEPLISALKDPDGDVREQAAFALGQLRDRAAVEALVIALKDSVADVRQQVAFALGQLRDPRAIDGLTAALKDANADVRQQAAFALGQLAKQ
jgi:HEAT repeat protein/beta-lactamase regulating signal transducer with metallopeptidase domain